ATGSAGSVAHPPSPNARAIAATVLRTVHPIAEAPPTVPSIHVSRAAENRHLASPARPLQGPRRRVLARRSARQPRPRSLEVVSDFTSASSVLPVGKSTPD